MDTDELREALLELLDAGSGLYKWKQLETYPHVEACTVRGEVVLRSMMTGIWGFVKRDAYQRVPATYRERVRQAAEDMEKTADDMLNLEAEARNIITELGVDKSEDFFAD